MTYSRAIACSLILAALEALGCVDSGSSVPAEPSAPASASVTTTIANTLSVFFLFPEVAGAASSTIRFTQNGADVTAVAGGTDFMILGGAGASFVLTWMGVCVQTSKGQRCQPVFTDVNGDFAMQASTDVCFFEISADTLGCDFSAKTLSFSLRKLSQGGGVKATGDLEVQ